MSERVTPPAGAWGASHDPLTPRAGHAVVVVVSIALAAGLVAGSSAVGGTGLVALLLLLLAVGALVVPIALVATLWTRARTSTRAMLAAAGAGCLLLLVWAVLRVVAVWPTITFPGSG